MAVAPDFDSEAHHLPDTPSEGVLLSSGMQYSLPQDTPLRAQINQSTKPAQQPLQHSRDVTAEDSLPSVIGDKFVPWQDLSVKKRKAKRSKIPLRPMLANEDSDNISELPARGSQSLTNLPSRPSSGAPKSPLTQQDDSISADVHGDAGKSNNESETRKLKRRTNWTAPISELLKSKPNDTSTAIPSVQEDAQEHHTPAPIHESTYRAPYVDASPRHAAQQHATSPVGAVLSASHPQPMQIDSPETTTGLNIINNSMITPPTDMPVSTQLITSRLSKTFVRFNLAVNRRSFLKMIKLSDCFDAVNLHETINNRFKHALQGQTPTEIAFTINDNEYAIDPDEGGQVLYDEFLQVLADSGLQSSPVVAEVRV